MTIIRADNPLPVRDVVGMAEIGDITGLASAGQIIINDDFKTGPQGWGQLYTQNLTSQLPVFWIKGRHRPRMEIRGSDISGYQGMLIKRTSQMVGAGFYLAEFMAAIHVSAFDDPRATLSPARVDFVLDTCDVDGNRHYFALRYALNDVPAALTSKTWNLQRYSGGTNSFQELSGGAWDWPANENKVLPIYVAMLVNTKTGKYHGININNERKYGALAGGLTNVDLSSLAPASGPGLSRFRTGFNPCVEMKQPDGSSFVEAVFELLHFRATYLGETL